MDNREYCFFCNGHPSHENVRAEIEQEREAHRLTEGHVRELREALYALLRFATKPQPRDEEEQEQVVAKVAKALKSAGKLDESEDTDKRKPEVGVFCLDHKKVMTNGICPKCGQQ